jgi:hypothetical protein
MLPHPVDNSIYKISLRVLNFLIPRPDFACTTGYFSP